MSDFIILNAVNYYYYCLRATALIILLNFYNIQFLIVLELSFPVIF